MPARLPVANLPTYEELSAFMDGDRIRTLERYRRRVGLGALTLHETWIYFLDVLRQQGVLKPDETL